MYCSCRTLIYLLFAVLFMEDSLALRDVKIKVPQAVVRGKDAELQCLFDLENEKLYSVKWYRKQSEFFRYTPNETIPVRVFPVKGIEVRSGESKYNRIVLENVSREISGPFSCEVTAERPSFFTVVETADLLVVNIPRSEPYITGLKKLYAPEEEIFHANCTSEHSYPGANITWYINGHQIRGPQVMKRTINYEKTMTVISTLRHRLLRKFFPRGQMKLQCFASIFDVYLRSTEEIVELSERRRRKNHHPDWPPTTLAPPVVEEDYYNEEEEDDAEEEEYSKFKLWFWAPSAAASNWACTVKTILPLLFVGNIFLR